MALSRSAAAVSKKPDMSLATLSMDTLSMDPLMMIELKIEILNFELQEKKDHHFKVSFTAYQLVMVPMLKTMLRQSNGP